jgi:hypothetical protein
MRELLPIPTNTSSISFSPHLRKSHLVFDTEATIPIRSNATHELPHTYTTEEATSTYKFTRHTRTRSHIHEPHAPRSITVDRETLDYVEGLVRVVPKSEISVEGLMKKAGCAGLEQALRGELGGGFEFEVEDKEREHRSSDNAE